MRGYKREWLDELTLSGEVAWGGSWGSGARPIRTTPISLVMREDLESWLSLPGRETVREPSGNARELQDALRKRGAMFLQELARESRLPQAFVEEGLSSLVGQGLATCDSFSGLRWLIVPSARRKAGILTAGRWSLLERGVSPAEESEGKPPFDERLAEFVARRMLHRTGVVFRKTLGREKQTLPWREIARACRRLEARGEIRGGRFVAGFDGEQYARPEAVALLREIRRRDDASAASPLIVSAADPLNFQGILTPEARVAPTPRGRVRVA